MSTAIRKPVTKQGAHGKLYLYAIRYRDTAEHDNAHDCRLFGYNEEHVRERFDDSADADGWEIVSVKRVRR